MDTENLDKEISDDIVMYPDEDDEEFEDYDDSDLKQVRKFAKRFKGARIEKVTREVVTQDYDHF